MNGLLYLNTTKWTYLNIQKPQPTMNQNNETENQRTSAYELELSSIYSRFRGRASGYISSDMDGDDKEAGKSKPGFCVVETL